MSYFQVPAFLLRPLNDTYRIASDYYKSASNNVKHNLPNIPSIYEKSMSSLHRFNQHEHADIMLFAGTALMMRVSLFFTSSGKRTVQRSWPSTLRRNDSTSSAESLFYYLTSCWYLLLPSLPAVPRPSNEEMGMIYDQIMGNSSLVLFTGSAFFFRVIYWKYRSTRPFTMPNNNSNKPPYNNESELFLVKQKNDFKDVKLQQFIETCQDRKATLKKVGRPEDLRRDKIARLKKQSLAPKSDPLQLSNEKLKQIRSSLNRI
jgi:hypothetical protein